MKQILTKLIPKSVKEKMCIVLQRRYRTSYSICGEDAILAYLFHNRTQGFYVDVGAYDPVAFSNTYLFYLKGWRGINIEMNEKAIDKFGKYRPEDITVHAAVSDEEKELEYYEVSGSQTMNSLSSDFITEQKATSVKSSKTVLARRLDHILEEHLPTGREIDFMSIDVEGHEPNVLRSNDWEKFRPHVLILESYDRLEDPDADGYIRDFLRERGYHPLWKSPNGVFFVEKNEKLTKNNRIK